MNIKLLLILGKSMMNESEMKWLDRLDEEWKWASMALMAWSILGFMVWAFLGPWGWVSAAVAGEKVLFWTLPFVLVLVGLSTLNTLRMAFLGFKKIKQK